MVPQEHGRFECLLYPGTQWNYWPPPNRFSAPKTHFRRWASHRLYYSSNSPSKETFSCPSHWHRGPGVHPDFGPFSRTPTGRRVGQRSGVGDGERPTVSEEPLSLSYHPGRRGSRHRTRSPRKSQSETTILYSVHPTLTPGGLGRGWTVVLTDSQTRPPSPFSTD